MFFKPAYRPGVNKRDTGLQNEGGYASSNMVRFKAEMPQPIGGWLVKTMDLFDGIARGNHAWRTLEGKQVYALGTSSKLYGYIGGALRDITPQLIDTTLNNIFTTVNGSSVVTVTIPYHRLQEGQNVTFANHQSTIGGLTVQGTFAVVDVVSAGRFTINVGSNATSTVTTPGGGYVDVKAALPAGDVDTPVTGYGVGPYGAGPYGQSGDTIVEARIWSLDNWGEFLLANPSGYGIFEWQPETTYTNLAYNGTFTGNADGWALGTGWAYASNQVNATAGTGSNLSQNVDGVLEGGRTYRVTFTVTRTAGTLKFRMNAGATPAVIDVAEASSPITKSGTYSRIFLCPADPKDIVFEKDATFAGSIDNVSYQLEDKAYRITTAPPRVDAMFVDPRGLVIALGTTLIDGTYSPTAARNSDLGNNRRWVPDTASLASEYVLRGGGGRLMAGLATSEQNLAWGDDGVFSFQYQGNPGEAYDVRLLGTKCGLISRHAMAEQNGFVAWMANTRQFFIFRGVSGVGSLGKPEVIACPIQEDVFEHLDFVQGLKCHAGVNPEFTEVWFFYPDNRDTPNGSQGECSRVAVVDWTTGTWVSHQMARTSWQASGVFQFPIGLTPDGRIYDHERGKTANGANLGAWIETSEIDQGEGDNLYIFKGIIPDLKDQIGNIGVTILSRMYPYSDEIASAQYVITPTTKRLNFRHKARQYRVRFDWLTTGGWGRFGANRYDIQATGAAK